MCIRDSYWIEKFHVDGWRLDVANEVDKDFWRSFRSAVRKANPEAVLIGEVWENAADWLKGDMFGRTIILASRLRLHGLPKEEGMVYILTISRMRSFAVMTVWVIHTNTTPVF